MDASVTGIKFHGAGDQRGYRSFSGIGFRV